MANCKGCGKEIVWGVTLDGGTAIPLEQTKHVYNGVHSERPIAGPFHVIRPPIATYISHFLTCPKASEFSGSKRAS